MSFYDYLIYSYSLDRLLKDLVSEMQIKDLELYQNRSVIYFSLHIKLSPLGTPTEYCHNLCMHKENWGNNSSEVRV